MKIFPAIDLRSGRVVRLTKGDYDRMTTYNDDPAAVAASFRADGAEMLHVVDLDGARDGAPTVRSSIAAITAVPGLSVQVGGGIRSEERICDYLELGVDRVILGSAAVNNFPWLQEMLRRYADHIVVGVDARDGFVAVHGWETVTKLDSMDFCRRLEDAGVQTVVYTDISKDGMLSGTNLEIYRRLTEETDLRVIASGGVSFMEEIAELKAMGVYGVIVGKAIYEKKLSLRECLAVARS